MKSHYILLAEDEPFLGKVVRESLEKEGYLVDLAIDGNIAWKLFQTGRYSICILDVMMPYTDGFSLAAKIRRADTKVPLIFLTAKSHIKDVREGYASGGNDYLKKPFSLDELFLRVKELLNRRGVTEEVPEKYFKIGAYLFNYNRQELQYGDEVIKMSHKESELLSLLVDQKNKILDRKASLIKLWGDDSYFNTRNMDVYITRLRNKLKKDRTVEIVNIRGYGYKLIC